jgi:hypothetical protein
LAEGVSEEKIKMWKANGWRTTDAKWWQKLTLERWGLIFILLLSAHLTKNVIICLFQFSHTFYISSETTEQTWIKQNYDISA